ncbi:MAG: T9SS type A sorting domain-containing protein, partial [Bacteroidales bacterium]
LELYSVNGELIKTVCLEGSINHYRIDVRNLKSGIYLIRLLSPEGKYAEEVIIKK